MTVPMGYKLTDVGVIPGDWEVENLGDITDIDSDNLGISTSPNYEFKYISLEDVNSGFLQGFTEIKFASAPSRARRKLKRKDVLFATVRPNLKSHLLFDSDILDWVCSTGFSVIRCKQEKSIPEYIFFHLFSGIISNQIDALLVGSNYPAVNSKDIKSLKFPVPTVLEQEAIARILSDTDRLITSLDKLIAKKRDLKQAAMQQLLTGKQRLEGFSGNWEVKRLGDFTDCTAGGTPSTLIDSYWGGNIRWMSSGELHQKFVYDVEGRITDEGLKNSSTKIIPPNCVLVGLAGQGKTRGTVALSKVHLCTNQSIAAIYHNDSFSSQYLLYNLDNRYEELRGLSTGDGGRGGLNLTIIRNILLPFPDKEEQVAIARILSDMDSEITALEQRRDKTKALKQGMMQELLTGRIRLV